VRAPGRLGPTSVQDRGLFYGSASAIKGLAAPSNLAAEQVALTGAAAAAARPWRHRRERLIGRSCYRCFRPSADATIGELDVEAHALADRRRVRQRAPVGVTHQRKTPRQHAAMGERVEKLPAMLDRCGALLQQEMRRALRTLGNNQHPRVLARDAT